MPNRAFIDAYERKHTRTGRIDFMVVVSDDYDQDAVFMFADKEDVPTDNIELLKKLVEEQHNEDDHGTSAEALTNILDRVKRKNQGMYIGGIAYGWNDIEPILTWDEVEHIFKDTD